MSSNSELKAKIDKSIQDMIDIAKVDIVDKIEKMWKSTIDEFYESYKPTWYKRTHSTYKASDTFNDINNYFFSPIDNTGAEIGIHISSDNIGDPYDAEPEWVFTRTFEKGYHGYTKKEAFEWSRYRIDVNGKPVYTWKKPSNKRLDKMKVANPTPQKNMNRKFKAFKKDELRKIVNSAFEEALRKNL